MSNLTNYTDLTGRVAVVIGGTSGLGRVIAMGLAKAGADVVVTGRRENLVKEIAGEIKALERLAVGCADDHLKHVAPSHAGLSFAVGCCHFDTRAL